MNSQWRTFFFSALIGGCLVIFLFLLSLLPQGSREVTALTSINGIPYPTNGEITTVTEDLAHVDVKLREPVFAKQLQLSFEYHPQSVTKLGVGVREGSFWLSYTPHIFYTGLSQETSTWQQAEVTIPLTATLADTDRSIDVMFMANPGQNLLTLATNHDETDQWQIRNLQASVSYVRPTAAEVKDYLKSVLSKERPL